MSIVKEKLLSPAFNEEDFKRVKKTNLEGLESMKKNSQYLASTTMANVLFGDSPYGSSMSKKNLKKIKLKDVQEYYNNYLHLILVNCNCMEIFQKMNFILN